MKGLFLILYLLVLTSCATKATGPLYRQTEMINNGSSRIIIYRFEHAEVTFSDLYINNIKLPILNTSGYHEVYVEPGLTFLSASGGYGRDNTNRSIITDADKTYYETFAREVIKLGL